MEYFFATIYAISAVLLLYVYYLYGHALRLLVRFGSLGPIKGDNRDLPFVTVILTVHNEEQAVGRRVQNLLSLDYPRERLEILIASDGSTDRTNQILREHEQQGLVRMLELNRVGKSEAQNTAVHCAQGEIIAFTDAHSIFESDYLLHLVAPFADPKVGCVTGNLRFRSDGSSIGQSQGYYWQYELDLRELESRLGILAVASGAAMAVRKSCFFPLHADVGEDCSLPLDIASVGLRVVHSTNATAWDTMDSDAASEFQARVRMTMRNWTGTWRRPELLNPLRCPGYAFALWSHKLLRWLSPFFILLVCIASIPLALQPFLWPAAAITATIMAIGFVGYLAGTFSLKLPIAGTVWSFLLANCGFLIGVLYAVFGRSVVTYSGGKPLGR